MEKSQSNAPTGTNRDALWIWGHDAGCYHRHAKNWLPWSATSAGSGNWRRSRANCWACICGIRGVRGG